MTVFADLSGVEQVRHALDDHYNLWDGWVAADLPRPYSNKRPMLIKWWLNNLELLATDHQREHEKFQDEFDHTH